MTERQARRICRLYYLDCMPIAEICEKVHESRAAVEAAIDDPAAHQEYLRRSEKTRERTKIRTAQAAELALEKQVDFLRRDVSEDLIPAQQHTARAVYGAGQRNQDDKGEIRITFPCGEIKIGMPSARVEGDELDD